MEKGLHDFDLAVNETMGVLFVDALKKACEEYHTDETRSAGAIAGSSIECSVCVGDDVPRGLSPNGRGVSVKFGGELVDRLLQREGEPAPGAPGAPGEAEDVGAPTVSVCADQAGKTGGLTMYSWAARPFHGCSHTVYAPDGSIYAPAMSEVRAREMCAAMNAHVARGGGDGTGKTERAMGGGA